MSRLKARPRQLEVDPECLRWTPVIVTNTVVSDADGDDDDEEEDEEPKKDNHKEVSAFHLYALNGDDRLMHLFLLISCVLFYFIYKQIKPIHNVPPMSWHMRQRKKREEEEEEEDDDDDDDDDDEEEEERKGFLEFPLRQSSPTSPPIRCPPPVQEPPRPPPPTNGERRPRGRPPKNWPWGKVKDSARVGRPPKIRPVEDDDDEDERTEGGKATGSATGPPSLFSLDRQESTAFHSLDMARHPSITPTRRGRPPRKKTGPKPRLSEGPGEGLAQLPLVSRLNESLPVRKSCFSESSEEEDDDDDEDDDDMRACSPPILTKPAMGLKCKVRINVNVIDTVITSQN